MPGRGGSGETDTTSGGVGGGVGGSFSGSRVASVVLVSVDWNHLILREMHII